MLLLIEKTLGPDSIKLEHYQASLDFDSIMDTIRAAQDPDQSIQPHLESSSRPFHYSRLIDGHELSLIKQNPAVRSIVKFYRTNCPGCEKLQPSFELLAEEVAKIQLYLRELASQSKEPDLRRKSIITKYNIRNPIKFQNLQVCSFNMAADVS